MRDNARWYVCGTCERIGPMGDFQGECRRGWTHGHLWRVDVNSPALRSLQGAVSDLFLCRQEIATLRAALEPFLNLDRAIGDEWADACEPARDVYNALEEASDA